ncbi:SRPBCC family protein [Streptomyces sp. NPDC056190]|uniref:SRPBCC family protein n=1 Tax=Streptomyces sp. NPDC056190 TaxID=3345741 RepID=UPI0035DB2215
MTVTASSATSRTTHPVRPRRNRRRRLLLGALAALVALLASWTAWTTTHPTRLTASIEIDATPDQVWQVLTDLPAYPEWNPFITSAQVTSSGGALRQGAHLRNVLHFADGSTTVFTPELLTVSPGRELRWLGRFGPGWIADGEHRFTIEQLGPHRVRLTQSESFTGVAVPFLGGLLDSTTLPQFRLMNQALAARVTSLAQG